MFSLLLFSAQSTHYFVEKFNEGRYTDRWLRPLYVKKGVQLGKFRLSAGNYYGDEELQRGLETLEARRNYLLYSNFSHTMDTRDKDLIIQYTLRLNMWIDCAGQYIKVLGSHVDMTRFSNISEYSVMFGPDICGATLRKTHIIIGHKGKYYQYSRGIQCHKDHLTHAYTLIIRKNNTVEYLIDGVLKDRADMKDRFNIPLTDEVPDPKDKKPTGWDDDEWIPDPNDKKPEDWVDDEFIPDPDAFRPPSWDEDIPWTPPMIKNPKYVGEWYPQIIKNPKFKGIWKPKMIKVNPPVPDPTFGHFEALKYLGLEFYQNTPGAIFNNFLVTDNEEYALQMLKDQFLIIRDPEVRSFDRLAQRLTEERELENLRRENDNERVKDSTATDDENGEKLSKDQKETRRKKKKAIEKSKKRKHIDVGDSL